METKESRQAPVVSAPVRRLIEVRAFSTVRGNRKPQLYEVPLPFLRIVTEPLFVRSLRMEFSGDGELWLPAQLPHVYHGNIQGCMLTGTMKVDQLNPITSLTNYSITYVYTTIRRWWHPLIDIDLREQSVSDRLTHDFMDQWERLSIEQVLAFITSKSKV